MDHVAVELARRYSEELKEPFLVAIGRFGPWDIRSISGRTTIEIKFETTPIRTGNVAIELHNSDLDEPSGINATKANLWVHICLTPQGVMAYEYETDHLKALVNGHSWETRDNNVNSECCLIPLDKFSRCAKKTFHFGTHFAADLIDSRYHHLLMGQNAGARSINRVESSVRSGSVNINNISKRLKLRG